MKFLKAKALSILLFTLFGSSIAQKQNSSSTDLGPSNTSSSNISPNTTSPSMYSIYNGFIGYRTLTRFDLINEQIRFMYIVSRQWYMSCKRLIT